MFTPSYFRLAAFILSGVFLSSSATVHPRLVEKNHARAFPAPVFVPTFIANVILDAANPRTIAIPEGTRINLGLLG